MVLTFPGIVRVVIPVQAKAPPSIVSTVSGISMLLRLAAEPKAEVHINVTP